MRVSLAWLPVMCENLFSFAVLYIHCKRWVSSEKPKKVGLLTVHIELIIRFEKKRTRESSLDN